MIKFGIVEDINDPQQLGRVRVRVFGIHTHEKTEIPTSALPWASVVQPTTSAANSGIGHTPRLLQGSLVTLMFLDEAYQVPLITGSIPSEIREYVLEINGMSVPRDPSNHGFQDPSGLYPKGTYKDLNDISLAARDLECFDHPSRVLRTSNRLDDNGNVIYRQTAAPPNTATLLANENDAFFNEKIWAEPAAAQDEDVIYPNNQVRESASGITEEWDDTPGNVRHHLFHPSGTYEEVVDDGSRTIKVIGKDYQLYMNGSNMYVEGNLNVTVSGDKRELIMGDSYTEITGNQYTTIKGSEYKKVNNDVDVEIGENHYENIGADEVRFINGNQTETTVKKEYHLVNGTQATSVQGNATFQYASKYSEQIKKDKGSTVIGNSVEVVGGNFDMGVKGNYDLDVSGNVTMDSSHAAASFNINSGTKGAARIDDTADTGDEGTGSHFDSNSAGTDKIETGSTSVVIGD